MSTNPVPTMRLGLGDEVAGIRELGQWFQDGSHAVVDTIHPSMLIFVRVID